MKIIDLFAGIGGFSLAAHWMGWDTAAFVEWDSFNQKVLAKNFPNIPIYGDIREFDGTQFRGTVDLVCGGFPCQPFSSAGQRKGTDDDRYLWPEMLRVIREVQPAWVVGENVAGIISMDSGAVLEEILSSLEGEGYNVQVFLIPALAVGAPHRRDRVWIVGRHSGNPEGAGAAKVHRVPEGPEADSIGGGRNPANTIIPRAWVEESDSCGQGRKPAQDITGEMVRQGYGASSSKGGGAGVGVRSSNSTGQGLQDGGISPMGKPKEKPQPERCDGSYDASEQFNEHWLPVATRTCGVDDGVSGRMDRAKRLKALGNAIVPQVAFEIFKSISCL